VTPAAATSAGQAPDVPSSAKRPLQLKPGKSSCGSAPGSPTTLPGLAGGLVEEERDLVRGRALDWRPAHHSGNRVGAVRKAGRGLRRAHPEAVALAPGGRLVAGEDAAHAGVVGVGRARAPGQRERDRRHGGVQRLALPGDAVLREGAARGELELVRDRAWDGIPREGGRPREVRVGSSGSVARSWNACRFCGAAWACAAGARMSAARSAMRQRGTMALWSCRQAPGRGPPRRVRLGLPRGPARPRGRGRRLPRGP